MYIKVVNKRLEAEVVPGDIVQSGVIISNSEVGLGSVNIQPLVYRLVCSNGMVVNDAQTLAALTSAGSMRQMKTFNCSHRRHWPLMTTHLP